MDLKAAILHYCKYQERCHAEVRNKLYELGFNTHEVELRLAELIETGVISEERYARAFTRGHYRMKQWGKEKIKQQLKLKKISDYCIKKSMEEIDSADYENTLRKLSTKKWHESRSDRSIASRKGKLYRYLIQKGYEKDLVMDAINHCIKIT